MKKVSRLEQLAPGVIILPVEAYGDGGFFQVNPPVVVDEGPVRSSATLQWPLESEWSVWVHELGGKEPRKRFHLATPTSDGVNIERKPGDHSAFFVYTPSVEEVLRSMTLDVYCALNEA